MRIAFTGHRNRLAANSALRAVAAEFPGAVWVHGGAEGFDAQVGRVASALGIAQEVIRPDYARHGRPAPLVRNRQIVAGAALLVACYDGRRTGGTAYTVRHAEAQGVPVRLLTPAAGEE